MSINRRDFLRNVAGVSGAAVAGSVLGKDLLAVESDELTKLPPPDKSGIEHIVVLMMENRSFDHMLGWLPGTQGKQAGLKFQDNNGVFHKTHRLKSFTGCPHPDPDHSYDGGRSEVNGGKMDGWLRTTTNDPFCIGYYTEADQPFYGAFARNFTTLSRYFPSILSSTFPNRVFSWAAQTDRLSNTFDVSTLPTIFDTLKAAGVSHRYYYNNLPFLGLWGTKYIADSAFYAEFLIEAALGALPAVSFVDPIYTLLDDGTGNDDHPHADIRSGEAFMGEVYRALSQGPDWKNTVMVLNWDEWGGFFEHIAPPRVIAPNNVDPDIVDGKALLGCRVPTVVASPFSLGDPAHSRVDSHRYDHTSVLKMIEWRYGLPPLTARDASNEVKNLALALDFKNPNFTAPTLPKVEAPPPDPCMDAGIMNGKPGGRTDSYDMIKSPLMKGWQLPPGLPL